VTTKEFLAIFPGATRFVMAEPPKESVRGALPQTPETTPVIPPRRFLPPTSENFASVSIQPGPKNETARITVPPPRSTAGATSHTQPAIVPTSIVSDASDSIPRWFCWGLLGISAFIFLIQIWNYALS
jgi:hypothetical protein